MIIDSITSGNWIFEVRLKGGKQEGRGGSGWGRNDAADEKVVNWMITDSKCT